MDRINDLGSPAAKASDSIPRKQPVVTYECGNCGYSIQSTGHMDKLPRCPVCYPKP